jgi:hypothetical protein
MNWRGRIKDIPFYREPQDKDIVYLQETKLMQVVSQLLKEVRDEEKKKWTKLLKQSTPYKKEK